MLKSYIALLMIRIFWRYLHSYLQVFMGRIQMPVIQYSTGNETTRQRLRVFVRLNKRMWESVTPQYLWTELKPCVWNTSSRKQIIHRFFRWIINAVLLHTCNKLSLNCYSSSLTLNQIGANSEYYGWSVVDREIRG